MCENTKCSVCNRVFSKFTVTIVAVVIVAVNIISPWLDKKRYGEVNWTRWVDNLVLIQCIFTLTYLSDRKQRKDPLCDKISLCILRNNSRQQQKTKNKNKKPWNSTLCYLLLDKSVIKRFQGTCRLLAGEGVTKSVTALVSWWQTAKIQWGLYLWHHIVMSIACLCFSLKVFLEIWVIIKCCRGERLPWIFYYLVLKQWITNQNLSKPHHPWRQFHIPCARWRTY